MLDTPTAVTHLQPDRQPSTHDSYRVRDALQQLVAHRTHVSAARADGLRDLRERARHAHAVHVVQDLAQHPKTESFMAARSPLRGLPPARGRAHVLGQQGAHGVRAARQERAQPLDVVAGQALPQRVSNRPRPRLFGRSELVFGHDKMCIEQR